MLPFACLLKNRSARAGDEAQGSTEAEAGVPFTARMVGTDFRRCEAVSEGWHEHRAGKDVSPRQVADGQRLRREIRVFPPLAQTVTKNHQRPNADARFRRVCGICGAQRNKAHSLAIGREAANSARPRKIWKTWSGTGGTTVT